MEDAQMAQAENHGALGNSGKRIRSGFRQRRIVEQETQQKLLFALGDTPSITVAL